MRKDAETFLQKLLDTPSPSGFEQPAAEVFRTRVSRHVDVLETDVHGNTIAVLNPQARLKVMLAGHIDEIGLMVMHIDEQGFLHVAPIGGQDPALLVGQRVQVLAESGPVAGVVGRKAIHLMDPDERNKAVRMESLWVDIGATDGEAARQQVGIGDPIVVDVRFQKLGADRFIARGGDDKAGVFVVAEVLRALSKQPLQVGVIGVATVQEEVGLRGATTSAYHVQPQAGIVVEVGHATDHPEADPKRIGAVSLGGGPILQRGANINPVLGRELIETARREKLDHQLRGEPRATGTDANPLQLSRGGVATALVRLPNRYMHTPVEMLSLRDLDLAVKLLTTYLANLPAEKDFRP